MMDHVVDCFVLHLGLLRRRQLLKRYDKAMQLFDPAAILTDSKLAQQLLQHRPQVPVISAQELLQDGVPVEG